MNNPPSPFASRWLERDRLWPMIAATVVFFMVYAVELGSFGFGIDEEVATFGVPPLMAWLQQGRWGMSLASWVLPDLEALPFLSTLIFGAGLLVAAGRALHDFQLRGGRAAVFAVVLVGFPVWLHIAQFSTLAAGFGLGIAAASIGAGLCAEMRPRRWLAGVALLSFAAAVYQTLAVYSLLYLLLLASARWYRPVELANTRARLRLWSWLAAGWVAGLVLYMLVQSLALWWHKVDITYVGGFVDLARLSGDPGDAWKMSWKFVRRLVNGRNELYQTWGMAILAMSWLGLLFPALPEERASFWRRAGFTWAVFLLGLALVLGPVFLSYATLPVRAQVAWPLLAAWLAARCPFPDLRAPWLRYAALGYFAIVAASIGASLFHADQLVRASDREISQQLVREMREVAGDAVPPGKPIPFTVSGIHRYPLGGQVRGAQVFGTSFFQHDDGSVWRIVAFWHVLGITNFEPHRLSERPALVEAAAAMPDWPAKGSIRLVDGIVVVRFGPATPPQLATN